MEALDRKLLRDLWRMKGQALAVAAVVASGVALLVMALSTLDSLRDTTDAYYDRYRFAEVFGHLERAPDALARKIAAIPGVQIADTRVTALTTMDVPGMAEPVVGRLISVPGGREPTLNRLAMKTGRSVAAGRDDEVVVAETFAAAHGLVVGDRFRILLNGNKRQVRIVGTALSPEYVYAIGPGALMPDDKRFGIVWMDREALAAAYGREGAFNDVTLALLRDAEVTAVIDRLDDLLEPYGGSGAYARADQISNWFLMNELEQLKTQAVILPAVFILATAFLTNTVMARMIQMERREISLLKAFGYGNWRIGWHYGQLALAMAAIGIGLGWIVGAALGRYNTGVYADFFHFPFLHYRPGAPAFVISALVSAAAALVGVAGAVRGAVALTPAEAMRPPAPTNFRHTAGTTDRLRPLDQPTRIILRQIARTPLRAAFTVCGLAMAVGVMIMSLHFGPSVTQLGLGYYAGTQQQDVSVGFFDLKQDDAVHALGRLPGVLAVEPMRGVPADLVVGTVTHRGSLTGLPQDGVLQLIDDTRGFVLPVPRGGLVLGSKLAEKLGVGIGDRVRVEVLEGARPILDLPVSGVTETDMDVPAYVSLATLNRAMGDSPVLSRANLKIDRLHEAAFLAALKDIPGVSSVTLTRAAEAEFLDTLGETILIFTTFFVGFSGALAMGMTYNAVRIALSERGRELATMRVLGFSRGEISYILLGEAALLLIVALPLGCVIGAGLFKVMCLGFETELFRLPFIVWPPAFATGVLIVMGATVLSAALVRRKLDRLDLVEALKTRE